MASALYAIVSPGGAVLNVITWDGEAVYDATPNTLVAADDSPNAQAGGTYAAGVFTAPAPTTAVPASATPLQARLALAQDGLLDQVNAAVTAAGPVAESWWEYAGIVERTNPYVAQIGAALSLNDSQLDALFVLAATF